MNQHIEALVFEARTVWGNVPITCIFTTLARPTRLMMFFITITG
jgi:hypothetical protein